MIIRDLSSLEDYAACVALQDETWGAGFSERVPTAILRVSQKIGGVAAGAFNDNDEMVGFVFGLTGLRDGELVHWSDMLAVKHLLRGQGIGEQLKAYQREKVVALGVRSMLWTFDPLQAGNAHFNINRLGAMPVEYVADMYGSNTGSTLHGALPTDRFVALWRLVDVAKPAPGAAASGDVPLANPLDADGLPTTALLPAVGQRPPAIAVQVPADFGAVQALGHTFALRWRLAVRELMTAWLDAGYVVTAFTRPAEGLPFYRLESRDPGTTA